MHFRISFCHFIMTLLALYRNVLMIIKHLHDLFTLFFFYILGRLTSSLPGSVRRKSGLLLDILTITSILFSEKIHHNDMLFITHSIGFMYIVGDRKKNHQLSLKMLRRENLMD